MHWPEVSERVVWLRHGVVEVERWATSAGETFAVVRPVGWDGEPAWIKVSGAREQLRPLVDWDVADGWLRELRAPTSPRTPGDLLLRRWRAERLIELGTADQQVAALAHAYRERYRPDVEDVALLAQLERLIVAEIACVLGRDLDELRDALRQPHARFAADAPPSGVVVAEEERAVPPPPAVVSGSTYFVSFEVTNTLTVTDGRDGDATLLAVPGTWDAVHPAYEDESEMSMLVYPRARPPTLPLDRATGRRISSHVWRCSVAVVADGAHTDPLVIDELWQMMALDMRTRGAVFGTPNLDVEAWAWPAEGPVSVLELVIARD